MLISIAKIGKKIFSRIMILAARSQQEGREIERDLEEAN